MTSATKLTPQVLWAQRKNCVFLTVCVEDCKNPVVKIEENSVFFSGKGGIDSKDYELTIDLFEPITTDQSVFDVRGRGTEIILIKDKEKENFWPRLTKTQQKHHWLKVDFNKWKDEDDESDEEGRGMGMGGMGMPGMGMPGMGGMGGMGDNMDFAEMMKNMGGLGGGEMGGKPNMDDLPDDSDSDDDDLPQLE